MPRRSLVLALALLGMSGAALAEPEPIKIGLIESMSGNLALYGQEGVPAFRKVIDDANKAGGIKSLGGAKIEVVLADDTSQPSRTAIEGRRLAEDGAIVLAGAILTSQMAALSAVLDEIKVPAVSFWAGSSRSDYLFTLGFPYDRGYANTMAEFIKFLATDQKFPIKRIATAYDNYEAGQQVNKFLIEKLKAAGFEIVGEVPLDLNATDYTSTLTRLRSLRADVVAGLLSTRDGVLLQQARYNLNLYGPIFMGGTGGYSDPALWGQLGPTISAATLTRNFFGMTGYSDNAKLPAADRLKADLATTAKGPIGQATFQAAQAAALIVRALESAGSRDREKIKAALGTVEIKAGSPDQYIPRAAGLSFGADRMLKDTTALMIQWTPDKQQQVVYPPAFATTAPRPMSPP